MIRERDIEDMEVEIDKAYSISRLTFDNRGRGHTSDGKFASNTMIKLVHIRNVSRGKLNSSRYRNGKRAIAFKAAQRGESKQRIKLALKSFTRQIIINDMRKIVGLEEFEIETSPELFMDLE